MDKLAHRLQLAQQTLTAFQEALQMPLSKIVRDGSIQRFELTYEILWKLVQAYLFAHENIDVNSPTQIFRSCFKVKLLDESQTERALEMAHDRNLTVHTYNEKLAEHIYQQLPSYYQLMHFLIQKIDEKIKSKV